MNDTIGGDLPHNGITFLELYTILVYVVSIILNILLLIVIAVYKLDRDNNQVCVHCWAIFINSDLEY